MGIDSLFDLSGKSALVTGASRGLGKAMALALAQAGCDVALNARSADSLKETTQEIQKLGRKAVLVPGDVADETQVKEFVKAAHQAFGKIDVLVNNAGIWEGTYFLRITKSDWDKMVEVNLTGAFLVAKAVGRVMLKQRSGKIINIASVLGLRGSPQAVAYCVTKGGVVQMTRVMAIELGPAGIQVNCLAPGLVATDMTKEYTKDSEAMRQYLSKVPLRRYGQPGDLAGAVVFLASKASDLMTGHVMVIDGGESLV
ncbi:MAG: 3-oxoacyl-ACP reductase FabG [Candidatus Omnitrophica bacterium]|nr:3-oxoacyl-ACP reductase FabG [Candidatus Omnitrophota bacterium]